MNHEEELIRMEEIRDYLKKVRTELVMSGYHDGWTIKWLEDKVVELETQLDKYKHKFND